MSDKALADRMARAIDRIEAAARRMEHAKAAPGLPFDARPGDDRELQAKYDALQAEASAALKQIEQILGTLEQDDAV